MGPRSAATWILVPRKRVACGEGADVEKCVGHGERKGERPIENSSVCMKRVSAQSISTNVSGLHLGIAKLQNSKLYDDFNKSTEGPRNGAQSEVWCQTSSPAMIIGRGDLQNGGCG